MSEEKPKKLTGRPIEWTKEKLDLEAKELVAWACKEDSLVLAEFYGSRGYDYDDVAYLEKISETFFKAKRVAKLIIGARREKGALKGKLDSAIVRKSMALYDPEMKAYEMEMKNASKFEVSEAIGEGLINAISEIESARSKIGEISRSTLEIEQSLLDQGLSGQEGEISDELGSEGAL